MCPTQYIALPRTTSPLPLHGYFMESKRWGDGKKPTLSLGSTIAFGGFIDRIRQEHNIDKAMLSMEIEIANIAYITNRQNSPSRRYFSFRMSAKKTNITLQILILEQQLLEHDGITTNPLRKIIRVNLRLALRNKPCLNL